MQRVFKIVHIQSNPIADIAVPKKEITGQNGHPKGNKCNTLKESFARYASP